MHTLNLSLLRERFIIHDPKTDKGKQNKAVIALSNRIALDLTNEAGNLNELFIIRTQNMHSCTRLASKIIQSFQQSGPLLTRHMDYDWKVTWDSVVNDYEYAFNTERWVAIYHEGHVIFETGERHPLLDVIEKCDANNGREYEDSILLAEDAFQKTGKTVKIEYDGNVALVVNLKALEGRCAIILRGADKTTTFNFSAASTKDKALSFVQTIGAAAAFLEGMQLAFMVGMNNVKIQMGIIERHSREEKQNREAKKRLSRLSTEITNLEDNFNVAYRPEKPDFQKTLIEAEKLAHGMFTARN